MIGYAVVSQLWFKERGVTLALYPEWKDGGYDYSLPLLRRCMSHNDREEDQSTISFEPEMETEGFHGDGYAKLRNAIVRGNAVMVNHS